MKTERGFSIAATLLVLLLLSLGQSAAQGPVPRRGVQPDAPMGRAFTYQGFLSAGGEPITDACDFQVGLWDDPVAGSLVAGPLEHSGVAVSQGRFTVQLDFGDVFDGTALWLELAVKCTGEPAYTSLAPRQELTAAPYASYSQAAPWGGIADLPAGFADDVDNDALAELFCASGQLAEWNGSAWVCAADDVVDSDADPVNELELPVSCNGGQIAAWDGSDWVCADDEGTSDHGALTGLDDDDHPQYFHLSQAETVLGRPAFNGGTASAPPFTVDSTYQVANLNADLLDGLHASDFAPSSHDHWGESWSGSGTGTGLTLSGGTMALYCQGTGTGLHGTSAGSAVYADGGTYGVYADGVTAVYGQGTTTGLHGYSNNTAMYADGGDYGLYALSTDTGVYAEADTYGVYGEGVTAGVFGVAGGPATGYGVYGFSYTESGVYGYNYTGGYGVVGHSHASGVGVSAWSPDARPFEAYDGEYPSGTLRFYITNAGNVYADGTYNTFVPPPDAPEGNTTYYALSAIQSPESWFEDFGTAALVEGDSIVEIEPAFAGTVNLAEEPYHVFLTPLGDCALYVAGQTPTHFTVKAIGGQRCSISFHYRIVAKHLGYEDSRLDVIDVPAAEEVAP